MFPAFVHINPQPNVNLDDDPIVLVLALTREVAVHIRKECFRFGKSSYFTNTCVYGVIPKHAQAMDLERDVEILIDTLSSLIDFMESAKTNLHRVIHLVLDEVDLMLDIGFDPREYCGTHSPRLSDSHVYGHLAEGSGAHFTPNFLIKNPFISRSGLSK